MCTFLRARAFLAAWLFTVSLSLIAVNAAPAVAATRDKPKRAVGPGQKLFEQVWEPDVHGQSRGDGLGPLFNERSCVACHFQGGVGGAGPNDKNVVLLTVAPKRPGEDGAAVVINDANQRPIRPDDLHRGFRTSATVVLHRFSTGGGRYQRFIDNLVGLSAKDAVDPQRAAGQTRVVIHRDGEGPGRVIEVEGTVLQIGERNTPALFGAGLISSIPKSEIEKVAKKQASEERSRGRGVHGRFVGRFGWRGQTMNLAQFIRGACAIELGLQVKNHPQADDPSVAAAGLSSQQVDLTERQCDDMTRFVSDLPAPGRRRAADVAEAGAIHRGSRAFEAAGCAVCHRPTLGSVRGIYSDLLVHDMGLALIDPMPAPLEGPGGSANPAVAYYGGGAILTPAQLAARQDWKTPPLWGLRDSGPYLHDGRAGTVEQAILEHDGESLEARKRFKTLSSREQADLLTFLDSLAAPDPALMPQATEVRLPLAVR